MIITSNCSCQAHCTCTLASGVNSPWKCLLNVLQELGLRQAGIPDNECIDITSDAML
eukprot:CAMPEP_0172657562 /NCGR_PEP_ID=MMETSP1074-20121228/2158_1 /TAXON_ID=2916 /ORGANISM="Ceratium fusus, Strain PA161109" /LENGTH=56 /DNA_ID=CAMNT_0013472649 /DNA_START=38 /DNA_END=204 /DNA_ORIENTATION=+